MLNFSEIKTKIGRLAQRANDTNYATLIGDWVQLSHRTLADIHDYWTELQETYSFNTADGTETYQLPNNFDKPFRLYDLTNKIVVTPKTEEEYSDNNLSNIASATEGNSDQYRIYGVSGVSTPISTSGDTVKAKSSASTESAATVVRVEGYLDSANLIMGYENITIPAASASTYVAGTTTFYRITHISKSANTTGYITIANSAGTVLEYLAPNERVAKHKIMKLGLIPDGTHSMRLLYKKRAPEMVNDYDYPFTECDNFLIMDGLGYAFSQDKETQRADYAWKKAEEALRILLMSQSNKLGPDYIHRIISKWMELHRR